MDECEIEVQTIGPATRPDGSSAIMIIFGAPFMNPITGEKGKQIVKLELPGQIQPAVTFENRVVLFLTKGEWTSLKDKPTVGDKFLFSFNSGLTLKKMKKK